MNLLLAAIVAGLCYLLGTQAQGPEIAFCNTYQTTQTFDRTFISKMLENEEEFSFLLTSGTNYGCKKLTFFPNGTYFYDYVDETNSHLNASGLYRMEPFSFSSPATIQMSSLPYGELGSVLGSISFNVLHAAEDQLVLLSCVNIGLIRSQQLHILIPEAKSSLISVQEVNATLQEMQVPLVEYLQEVQQVCSPGLRQFFVISWIRRLIRKLGINLPFYLNQDDATLDPLLLAALANPNFQLQENNALVPESFRQEPGVFSSQASPPTSVMPSFVYPQPAPFFQQPNFVGQEVVSQVPASWQQGWQRHQRPVQVFQIPTSGMNFGGQAPQFLGAPSTSALNFVTRKDQSTSVPFFLVNSPSRPVQVANADAGLPNAYYQG